MPAPRRLPRRLVRRLTPSAIALAALGPLAAGSTATPVATSQSQEALLGRVFPEPSRSVNYIGFDRHGAPAEFAGGLGVLAQDYPRYLTVSTVAAMLGNRNAVSVGADGIPAGRPGDTGDGRPLHVMTVTDRTVPDAGKRYAVLMFAHSLEPCGREGVIRAVEDLLRDTRDPGVRYSDGSGAGGTHTFTAAELLRRVKLLVIASSPDGWAKGDLTSRYDQYTGGGLNSNRVAWQPGWIFQDPQLTAHGYRTGTEPEGIGPAELLLQIRRRQLHGRPFTVGLDVHGPLPTALVINQTHGLDPAGLQRDEDLGNRYVAAMDAVFHAYASDLGASAFSSLIAQAQAYRDALRSGAPGLLDPVGGAGVGNASGLNATVNTAGDYPLQWATPGNAFDTIGYDASSTWSGFMAGELGASAQTIEANCTEQAPYDPAQMQLFVDNVRAAVRTMLAFTAGTATAGLRTDLLGTVGYLYDGHRVTSARNRSPVPPGFPGTPLVSRFRQVPYSVNQIDYLRDLAAIARPRARPVSGRQLARQLPRLSTLVVADRQAPDPGRLARWVRAGHNLVLTDSALLLLPRLGIGRRSDISLRYGYVGYADFDRRAPLAAGLPARARETYDPVALGMPLLMERDGYWHCNSGESPGCASGTLNSAPIWTIERDVIARIPGAGVAGTADPPATRRTTREGNGTLRAEVFTIPLGRGRIVGLGALLPHPSDRLPHAFGLQGYSVTTAAQTVFLRALRWRVSPMRAHAARPGRRAASGAVRPGAGSAPPEISLQAVLRSSAISAPAFLAAPDPAARAYAGEMLAHHRQAITIASLAAARTGRAAVRVLATAIILEQTAEIAQLRTLMAAWPRYAAPLPLLCRPGRRGLASRPSLAALRQARGAGADALFARLMSRHHQGAVRMAERALQTTLDPDVRRIAGAVMATQATELRALGRIPTTAGDRAPFAGLAGL